MAALAQRELKITREHIADSMAQLRAAGKDLNGRPSIAGEDATAPITCRGMALLRRAE